MLVYILYCKPHRQVYIRAHTPCLNAQLQEVTHFSLLSPTQRSSSARTHVQAENMRQSVQLLHAHDCKSFEAASWLCNKAVLSSQPRCDAGAVLNTEGPSHPAIPCHTTAICQESAGNSACPGVVHWDSAAVSTMYESSAKSQPAACLTVLTTECTSRCAPGSEHRVWFQNP